MSDKCQYREKIIDVYSDLLAYKASNGKKCYFHFPIFQCYLCSQCFCRFITSSDELNGKASLFESFAQSTKSFDPDLVVFSGLHMMEGQSKGIWRERLDLIALGFHDIDIDTRVPTHLELASMANPNFIRALVDKVFCSVIKSSILHYWANAWGQMSFSLP